MPLQRPTGGWQAASLTTGVDVRRSSSPWLQQAPGSVSEGLVVQEREEVLVMLSQSGVDTPVPIAHLVVEARSSVRYCRPRGVEPQDAVLPAWRDTGTFQQALPVPESGLLNRQGSPGAWLLSHQANHLLAPVLRHFRTVFACDAVHEQGVWKDVQCNDPA